MIVCELSTASRIFYRIMAPLIAGGALLSVAVVLVYDFSATTAPWLGSWAIRLSVAILQLGFALWLASRISAVNASIRLEGKEIQVRRFWSGRVVIRALSDLVSVSPDGLRFRDGTLVALEGRAGPGVPFLLAHKPAAPTSKTT